MAREPHSWVNIDGCLAASEEVPEVGIDVQPGEACQTVPPAKLRGGALVISGGIEAHVRDRPRASHGRVAKGQRLAIAIHLTEGMDVE